MKLKLSFNAALILGINLAVLTQTSLSQAQSTTQATSAKKSENTIANSGWQVNCKDQGKGLQCKVIQTIAIKKTRSRLLNISVQQSTKGAGAAVLYQLPHGIFLPDGVRISIDKKSVPKIVIQTCDRQGCYAGQSLKADELKRLQTGKILSVAISNLKKKTITINVPLSGFDKAYAKLK